MKQNTFKGSLLTSFSPRLHYVPSHNGFYEIFLIVPLNQPGDITDLDTIYSLHHVLCIITFRIYLQHFR